MFGPERLINLVYSALLLSSRDGSDLSAEGKGGRIKRIGIIGGGTGGIGALKAILEVSDAHNKGWEVELLEARNGLGGVWLQDENPPKEGRIPESPVYPALITNTPHPTMTYPGFPFPPLTPLYPGHAVLAEYHKTFIEANNLSSYINLNTRVLNASYVQSTSQWEVNISISHSPSPHSHRSQSETRRYDHLVIASGHNTYPNVPHIPGRDGWEKARREGERKVVHSAWYRNPQEFEGRIVVVVGFGASGLDIARQALPYAKKVYHSYSSRSHATLPNQQPIPGTVHVPRISHFTSNSIVFTDNTTITTSLPTTIILGTGYNLLVPFLRDLDVISPSSPANKRSRSLELTTNLRYIQSLHQHIFAITHSLPKSSLSFVGLPVWIANAPSDYAQGLYVAHGIADESWLPDYEDGIAELKAYEDELKEAGYDINVIGHRFPLQGQADAYQNNLISVLRQRSPLPLPPYLESDKSRPYVEEWRTRGRNNALLMKNGWARAVAEGVTHQFLDGVESEEEWAGVMDRVEKWEAERESREKETL